MAEIHGDEQLPAFEPQSTSPEDAVRARVDRLHTRTADLVRARSEGDADSADPLRGLYLTAEAALRRGGRASDGTVAADDAYVGALADSGSEHDRMDDLAWRTDLTVVDVHVLLTALAPEVDRRFEPLFGYLNDDVTRRRATVSLAADLIGLDAADPAVRARFHAQAPLRAAGLVVVEDADRPLPSRMLRVPDRVVAHLLGDDGLDEVLVGRAVRVWPDDGAAPGALDTFSARLVRLVTTHSGALHVRDARAGRGTSATVRALIGAGLRVVRCELPTDDLDEATRLTAAAVREAHLCRAVLVAGPLPERPQPLVRLIEDAGVPGVLVDPQPLDLQWSAAGTLISLDAPSPPRAGVSSWAEELGADAVGLDLDSAVGAFRFDPDQVRRAVAIARVLADGDGVRVGVEHLRLGARRQGTVRLDQHARRVEPAVGWSDLVLPDTPGAQLRELVLRAHHRDRVLGDWRLRPGGARGRGVTALFAGESGTGKTLAAEVVAGELGVVLYVVDLSSVVDKYIGETEKNLDRVFTEADQAAAVLLFDEADAIFGKRSEVKDAHDRHANMESAFLLQRLEAFDGVAILTTNLRANIDEAFTRRFDLVVDFPFPDATLRTQLWRQSLAQAPCAPDFDASVLGQRYELSGGAIRSAALTAAYLAAHQDRAVGGQDATEGADREYRKSGRVVW